MCCDCRRPINCYNDKTRYKTMFVLYIIDLIFFIIRLSLVSNDISKGLSDRMGFLAPILLFDLIASVPIIICNVLYVIMRCCVAPLNDSNNSSFERLWHFATMTCLRLHLNKDHPQAILLMRIIIIISSFLLKFICFVIAAACSARFHSECTAYTVFAAFSLLLSILIIISEFIHFFRLWKYNPTDTKNGNDNQAYTTTPDTFIEKSHRGHLGFIHHSLLNDQNASNFRHSRCKQGFECKSKTLHHYLFYHSLESQRNIDFTKLETKEDKDKEEEKEKKSFIAFYQTTKQEALDIAQNGFPYGDENVLGYKDYLHLKQTIFFTLSCTERSASEATICVRLNLGRIQSIISDEDLRLNHYFGRADGECDTIYVESTRRLYLRMPAQIEKWIITINKSVPVNNSLDGTLYQPCI